MEKRLPQNQKHVSKDVVRTVKYEMAVVAVEHDMVFEATVEVCAKCGFFTGMREIDSCQFIVPVRVHHAHHVNLSASMSLTIHYARESLIYD